MAPLRVSVKGAFSESGVHLESGHVEAGIRAFTVSSERFHSGHPHLVHQPSFSGSSALRRCGHALHTSRRRRYSSFVRGWCVTRLDSARTQETARFTKEGGEFPTAGTLTGTYIGALKWAH